MNTNGNRRFEPKVERPQRPKLTPEELLLVAKDLREAKSRYLQSRHEARAYYRKKIAKSRAEYGLALLAARERGLSHRFIRKWSQMSDYDRLQCIRAAEGLPAEGTPRRFKEAIGRGAP